MTSIHMQREVDHVAAVLERPVLVEDADHQPLWWSAQGVVDGLRSSSILQREVSPAALAVVARLGLRRADGPVRTPASAEADMLSRWCVPLRVERDLLGFLWVLDPDETLSESELTPAIACAELAARFLSRQFVSGEGREHRRDLLLGRLAAANDRDAERELIALEDLSPAATVVVQLPSRKGGWQLQPGMSVHADAKPDAIATSGAPVPLADLRFAVGRAKATARVLRAGANLTAPSWDHLGVWRLIVEAPSDVSASTIHPAADVLSLQPGPDLLSTVRVLLDCGGDVALAASELHIHRTTLYYRIERVEALTGVNLRSSADRVDLHMAIRLAAYRLAGE